MIPTCEQFHLIESTASISEALIHQNKLPPPVVRRRGRPPTSTVSHESSDTTSDDEEKPLPLKKRLVHVTTGSAA